MKALFNFVSLIGISFFVLANLTVAQDKPAQNKLPKLLSYPEPVYPKSVTMSDLKGEVHLYIKIDEKGKVSVFDSFGPMAPCSNLNDSKIKAIRKAVIEATEKAVFEIPAKPVELTERFLIVRHDVKSKNSLFLALDDDDVSKTEGSKEVQGTIINGKALSLPKPNYPFKAAVKGARGTVSVQVVVGEDGRVLSTAALNGHQALRETSSKAACKAIFSPTTLDGAPVKVSGIITYNFVR